MKKNYLKRINKKRDNLFLPIIKALPKWVTPNILSSLRFPLGFIMFGLIIFQVKYFLLICFILWLFAKFIDCLDGGLARLKRQVTWNGGILDAFSDRFVLLMLVVAAIFAYPYAWILFWAMLTIIMMLFIDITKYSFPDYYQNKIRFNSFYNYYEFVFRGVYSAMFLIQYLLFY
ncbi:MAG: CDP-alcohol phosphatidyltransferase family protein [Patescibacteria group bacterium]